MVKVYTEVDPTKYASFQAQYDQAEAVMDVLDKKMVEYARQNKAVAVQKLNTYKLLVDGAILQVHESESNSWHTINGERVKKTAVDNEFYELWGAPQVDWLIIQDDDQKVVYQAYLIELEFNTLLPDETEESLKLLLQEQETLTDLLEVQYTAAIDDLYETKDKLLVIEVSRSNIYQQIQAGAVVRYYMGKGNDPKAYYMLNNEPIQDNDQIGEISNLLNASFAEWVEVEKTDDSTIFEIKIKPKVNL